MTRRKHPRVPLLHFAHNAEARFPAPACGTSSHRVTRDPERVDCPRCKSRRDFPRVVDATFDRFDVCEAYWLFAAHYHGGMHSPEYALFTRLHKVRFQPRPSLSVETLTLNGRAIFDGLVRRAGFYPWPSEYKRKGR